MKKKWITMSFALLLAAGVLAGGIYLTWLRTPPPMPANVDEAIKVLSSPQYSRLSEAERQPYIQRARELGEKLSGEERSAMWKRANEDPEFRKNARDVQNDVMLQRAREFAKADPAKRKQIINTMVMMEMAARAAGKMPPGPRGGGGGGDANAAQRRAERKKWMQDKIENGNPQSQAYMSEFFKALMDRRKELGLPAMGK